MDKHGNYEWDWANIPTGSTFTAIYRRIHPLTRKSRRVKLSGRIYKNPYTKTISLCHNNRWGKNYYEANNKLGYKYSISIGNGSQPDVAYADIDNLQIFLPEKGYKIPQDLTTVKNYIVIITAEYVKVGCTPIDFEWIEALYKRMLQLREKKGL